MESDCPSECYTSAVLFSIYMNEIFLALQTKREKESVVKKVEDSKVKLKQQQAQLQKQQQ